MKLLVLLLLVAPAAHAQRFTKLEEELIFSDPPFKQCHASTIIETPGNKLLVACFGGSHEGNKDVAIWTTEKNSTWSKTVKVAGDESYPCWNPVLFRTQKGKLFLFYKAGPNPREWWGLYKTSANNGITWSEAIKLPNGILGPIKNKPVQLKDGTILSPTSVEVTENRWQAYLERSTDEGQSWQVTPIDTASPFRVIQPSVLQYANGRLQVLCRSNQNRVVTSWSDDKGLSWSKLDTTQLLNPNSGTDAVTLKSGWQLIVYNPGLQGKDWSNSRGKLAVAVSKDGITWKDVLLLENGDDRNEYSYPAVIQTKDGRIHITYTFNRKNVKHVVLREDKKAGTDQVPALSQH
ncbi:exo-alpha-sialidase [uncultured Chitinophaga sp.]|uniref:sialidase family protein n=1 Tax=uncultured Chitinophaga sp. TaxID=339340 RepID=UPI0025DC950F|nr:sialidase family protein [uncultured Chitinophaga sp.]